MSIKYSGIIVNTNDIESYAEKAARDITPYGTIKGSNISSAVLKSLSAIKSELSNVSKINYPDNILPKAVEWLLDNWYIAEREGKSAAEDMKKVKKLRAVDDKSVPGKLAEILISASCGKIDDKRISLFLNGCQESLVLSEKELSVFTAALTEELIFLLEYAVLHIDEEYAAELMENIFTSLRFLNGFDMGLVLENVNRVERELCRDPAGIYPKMDEETKSEYRRELSRMAETKGYSEYKAAVYINKLAENENRHIGYYIFKKPFGREKQRNNGNCYIAAIVLISLFLTILMGFLLENPLISMLLLFPLSEIVKNLIDFIIIKTVTPKHIPRLALSKGVPNEGRTVCVISALLSSEKSAEEYAGLLEEYYLANKSAGMNLKFGILGDLAESKQAECENDAAIIDAMKAAIEGLNSKYGHRFYFFCRKRVHNEQCSCYMGWERKRGAILELVCMLKGTHSGIEVIAGIKQELRGTRYIITLDSDTVLGPDTATELIGAMLHPLNHAVIDEKKKVVVDGCGIIQPRISVGLESANTSDFTRIFAGRGGTDPYGGVVSDVYQDIFGRGSFNGKGIIDVDAYYRCVKDSFPENTILSHDLLEGAYLGCTYMGECELTDGYPYKVVSYYERMHRWVRGDWQTIPWLCRKVKNASGEIVSNPLTDVDKWKIADNLRRSLVPVFTFLSLITGMLTSGVNFVWAGFIAVLSAVSMLLISSAELAFRGDKEIKLKYHSTVLSGFAGCFLQTIIRLIFLPYEAWISASAAVTAIYRMKISHKNMLSWVTAADIEVKNKNKWYFLYYKMWICPAIGIALWLISPHPAACAVGIVWFFAPLYAAVLSIKLTNSMKLSSHERNYIMSAAADIWRYFDDFVTAQDNYLPPDNWQEQPAVGIAHRTSPTNIGLAMLSAISAYDMGITSKQNALGVIENMLASVKRLKKWNGHLYNWYDTRTLEPLRPQYVSTVDSGNLAASLIVLKETMYELEASELADEIGKLLDGMSFTPLYDSRRKLFYVGWDIEKDKATDGWYDLMASEARQTSFIAIARGDVPRKHWRALSRVLVSQDNYSGMASWTGTMFEYMMPNLLLPCYKNSMMYESSKFCIYVQKKATGDIPWGMSESAFYAFDQSLSYRYKAHGAQRLALKRGMKNDKVISPYSTFLAMQIEPHSSIKNLRKLETMGLTGRYGFYEAADFTKSRTDGKRYRPVKTFMVHHLGMSIIAANNAVNGNIMQQRFLKNREMAAYRSLLQEKVIAGGITLKHAIDIPEKPGRIETQGWSYVTDAPNIYDPMCCLLSNGSYTVMAAENGMTQSSWGEMAITLFEPDQLSMHNGMIFTLKTENETMPLTPAPYFAASTEYSAEFSGAFAGLSARQGNIMSSVLISVPPDETGEKRDIELYSTSGSKEAVLRCAFDPVLTKMKDFAAHPAYSRLSLEMRTYENKLIIKRRSRENEPERYMCIACSMPTKFYCGGERGVRQEIISNLITYAPEPPITADTSVLVSRKKINVSYAVAVAYSETDALNTAERILENKTERVSYSDKIAAEMKMDASDIGRAFKKISALKFVTPYRRMLGDIISESCNGQDKLWKFGISGDVPIVTAEIDSEDKLNKARALVREHILLTKSGIEYDLVLLTNDAGDYRTPVKRAVADYIRAMGCEHFIGQKGGIHFVDVSSDGVRNVLAMVSINIETEFTDKKERRHPSPRTVPQYMNTATVNYYFNESNNFVFDTNGTLPEYTWSNVMANPKFGYIACDAGTGHMWHLNSRENKINDWINRNASTDAAEELKLLHRGKEYSLYAANDGINCHVTFGFGFTSWEKDIDGIKSKVTAFVSMDDSVRLMIIELEGASIEDKVLYCTKLMLADSLAKSQYIVTAESDNLISASNPANTEFKGDVFRFTASVQYEKFTCDRLAWAEGTPDGETGGGLSPCIAAVFSATEKLVIVSGCEDEVKIRELADVDKAKKVLALTEGYWHKAIGKVAVKTPDKVLDSYMNGWALYQNIACRIFARASVYQCGGAYGFRDQLQDVCAVTDIFPEMTKNQILLASAHQFEEGDVQHWWHKSENGRRTDKGVRTKCTDDLLWLVYSVCEYTERTGDYSICDIEVPYIKSNPLSRNEKERYEHPEESEHQASVFQHCVKAVECVINRGTGEHGLCYIGTGDWNDGMNMVGENGTGESVWLTWFASYVIGMFAELCNKEKQLEFADRYREISGNLRRAADKAWDGEWYLRGYYDDGTKLGSHDSDECKIDSIAQSFAVFAGGDDKKRTKAMECAEQNLFDKTHKVMKLFSPPFNDGVAHPGYIRGYCPGYRENGGQYTHAAIWFAIALLENGNNAKGWEILKAILPQYHDIAEYKKEPFVIPADVCSDPRKAGMGGWTWYTGSAGWYYRAVMENLLGIRQNNGRLKVQPKLPPEWDGYEAQVEIKEQKYLISVKQGKKGRYSIEINGEKYENS